MKEDNMKQGWVIKKLGDITNSINGLWTGKKPPFITIAVIRNTNFTKECKLDTSDIAYIDVEVKQYANRKLQCGDIIIEKSGGSDKQPVGRPILFNIKDGEYSFSNFTSTIRVNDKMLISPNFLHKYLAFIYGRGDTAAMQSKTTGIRNLDFNLYKSINVPVPPLPVQEQIVSELDLLSDIIEKKRKQLKELDALAQSIFYDMFGDPITNEKGWEVKKLGEVCEVTSFKRVLIEEVVETGIPFIRGTELTALSKLPNSKDYPFTLFITKEHYERVKAISGVPTIGDLLIPSINSEGLIWELDTDEPRYYKDGRVLWVHTNHKYNYSKALKYILSYKLRMMYNELASGATFIELKLFVLRDIELPFPPLPLQHQFASKIEAIERQKELIKQSISETETLFNERMQHYFS